MEIFLDKGTIEFLTVATEFCAFIEKTNKFDKKPYLEKLHKILSLIYLKASLLQPDNHCQELLDEYGAEAFISEYEYEYIRATVSNKLSSSDSYINIYNSASNDSGYEQAEISECIADVYHNLKNFVENCRSASEESAQASRAELINDFREYWGYRNIALLAAIHAILYNGDSIEDDDENDEFRKFTENANSQDKTEQQTFYEKYKASQIKN